MKPENVRIKPVAFLGDSLARLRAFPSEARRSAGHQLDRVQRGLDPDDWKPMPSVGAGVREIRVRERAGIFRVIYLASIAEAVYVLNAFQKKTQRTPQWEIDLATERLRALKRNLS
jgi:phage-related protein